MNTTTLPHTLTLYLVQDGRHVAARLLRLFAKLANIACIGVGAYGERTLATIEAVRPEVVVADIGVGRPKALQRVRTLRKAAGPGALIVLAHSSAAAMPSRYVEAGADVCFDITMEFDTLVQMLRRLAANGRPPQRVPDDDAPLDMQGVAG